MDGCVDVQRRGVEGIVGVFISQRLRSPVLIHLHLKKMRRENTEVSQGDCGQDQMPITSANWKMDHV